jgi:DNA-binding protein HU-beta
MTTVNKSDLVRQVSAESGASLTATKEIVDVLLDVITKRAEAGDALVLAGFGKFVVRARPARKGRNPATGAQMEIPETRKLTFKAAAARKTI